MCSMFFPRSSMSTRRPFSVSSFAAHPPEIPEPTTIASYVAVLLLFVLLLVLLLVLFCTASSLRVEDFSLAFPARLLLRWAERICHAARAPAIRGGRWVGFGVFTRQTGSSFRERAATPRSPAARSVPPSRARYRCKSCP